MRFFSKGLPSHLIAIDPANKSNKDWVILIEAGTIVGLNGNYRTDGVGTQGPDDAYVFVDRERFEDHAASGGFLEHAEFLGNLYGTPLPEAPTGSDLVLEIEVQGAAQVRADHPEALIVFVVPPSPEEQERRLRGRGDPEETVRLRLAKAAEESKAATHLGAKEVVNDNLDQAVQAIQSLIEEARAKTS